MARIDVNRLNAKYDASANEFVMVVLCELSVEQKHRTEF